MSDHTVQPGECFHSVADAYGFLWKTLWDHPSNAPLKDLRKDPSIVNPGDVIHIPDKRQRTESAATEKRHVYRRKGTPAKVRIRVMRNDQPRANLPYTLEIDGTTKTGTTDGQGMVEMTIPPSAQRGELRVGTGDDLDVYAFQLGGVNSVDTEDGARQRLRDLGYDADDASFEDLLRSFQGAEGIQATGQLDQATQDRLKQRFGE